MDSPSKSLWLLTLWLCLQCSISVSVLFDLSIVRTFLVDTVNYLRKLDSGTHLFVLELPSRGEELCILKTFDYLFFFEAKS